MPPPHYSRDLLDRIRAAVPLDSLVSEHAELRPGQGDLVCACVFHQETKPSMHVYPDGHYHCYGCQARGDIFTFVQEIEGLTFNQAVRRLAERARIPLEEDAKAGPGGTPQLSRLDHSAMAKSAAEFYRARLAIDEGRVAREYLLGARGISQEMVEAFGLGYSPNAWDALKAHLKAKGWARWQALDARLVLTKGKGTYDAFRNRVMFPIQDAGGAHLGFGARALGEDDGAKYINSAESPHFKKASLLYGLYQARKSIRVQGRALVTEGYTDVISLHQHGFDYAVGVLGTAIGAEHVAQLARMCDEIIFLFDGDSPGRAAAFKAATIALMAGADCRVALLPEGEDPDSLLRGHGREAMASVLREAQGGLTFCLDRLGHASPQRVVAWVKDFLANLHDPRLRAVFVPKIAQGLRLSEYELRRWEEAQVPADVAGDDAPESTTAVPPEGHEQAEDTQLEDLLKDEDLLWGFVVRPDYCTVFKGRALPFKTDAARALFTKLCLEGNGEPNLSIAELQFLERCKEEASEAADASGIYAWYTMVKAKADGK